MLPSSIRHRGEPGELCCLRHRAKGGGWGKPWENNAQPWWMSPGSCSSGAIMVPRVGADQPRSLPVCYREVTHSASDPGAMARAKCLVVSQAERVHCYGDDSALLLSAC